MTIKLGGGLLEQADYSIHRYVARPPAGTTLEDVLSRDYWGNHLTALRPGMELGILSQDFSLDIKLRVLTVHKTHATFRVLEKYAEPDVVLNDSATSVVGSDAIAQWAGPNAKWRVMHNGEVIEANFATKEDAEAAAKSYNELLKAG